MSKIRLKGTFPCSLSVPPSVELVVIDESNFRDWQTLLAECKYKSWVAMGSYKYFRKKYFIWIGAIVGDELVGTCASEFKYGKPFLAAVGVIDKHRKKGIGAYLAWVVKEALHIRGYKNVFVDVHKENKAAVAAYKKAGFK